MRFALISDVHGNLEALRAALDLVAPQDAVLCTGDIVGYGPDPNECVALVRERATATVLGNHDVAAIDNFGLDYFNPLAREALEWTQGVLSPQSAQWLSGLDYEIRAPDYLMVHGAPVNYFAYILDNGSAAEAFAATDARIVIVGHTHLAECYERLDNGRIKRHPMYGGGRLELSPSSRYIINPGSVGQPRDGNPNASIAFYDPISATVVWQRFPYAIEPVREKMAAAKLPQRLADRLLVGR